MTRRSMRRIKRQILSLFAAIFLLPSIVLAEKLTLGTSEFHPWSYEQGDQLVGIDVDIGREIFKLLGIELEIVIYPWRRLTHLIKYGELDGILAVYKSAFQDIFSESLEIAPECMYRSKVAIYALKDRKLTVAGPADLAGKSVGVVGDFSFGPDFDKHQGLDKPQGFDRVDATHKENLVRRLEKGRVDFAVEEDKPFWFYTNQLGFQGKFEELYIVKHIPICMGFSKKALGSKSKALAGRVSEIIRQLKQAGKIQEILNTYN